jgi:EmrB/QacA subfamily drug resistance transporter
MVFVGVQLGMILSTLDGTIVATALPTIGRDLGAESARSWVITAYLLAQVATMPIYGKIGDLYGRKRVYLFALSVFTVGSVLCGTASSITELVVFRSLQGLGSGGLGVLAMAIVADIVPARQLGRWLGYQGALFAIASLVGPLTGGVFVDHLSWRWAFYINLPLAVMSAVIVTRRLHVPYQRVSHAIDYLGAALLTGALGAIVIAASIGGRTVAWLSPEVLGLAAVVVVLGALLIRRERRVAEPVLPLRMFAARVVRVSSLLNLTSGALFASGIYFLPVFMQQVGGVSATESGLLLIPFMFTTAFTTLVAGRRVERTGRYRIWPIVGSVFTMVGVALLATLTQDSSVWLAAGFGAVLGSGMGFIMQTSLLALQNGVEYRDLGVATSTALLGRMLGVTLGAAVLSAVYQARLEGAPGTDVAAVANAIPWVYLVALPVAAVTIVLALRLPEHALRDGTAFDAGDGVVVPGLAAASETGII